MNIHFLQHVPFEDLGALEQWASVPENRVTSTRFYEDNKLPFVDLFDVLVVLGGPMGVHDEDRHRWLIVEKELIRKALDKGKKVIGICLGAQLIADVLGASVSLNPQQEIGWFDVTLDPQALAHPVFKGFESTIPAFHWHGDTFALPEGAVPVGRSAACARQGFLWNNQALALQFHLEITATEIEGLTFYCKNEIKPGPYVQEPHTLLQPQLIEQSNALALQLIGNFMAL